MSRVGTALAPRAAKRSARARVTVAGALWLAIAACERPDAVRVDPPWPATAWAVVVALEGAVDPPRAVEPGVAAWLSLDRDGPIYAAAFDVPLDGCTIEAGAGALPAAPIGAWEASLADGALSRWTASARAPPLTITCRAPPPDPECGRVLLDAIDIGPTLGALDGVWGQAEEALVGSGPAHTSTLTTSFYRVDRGGRAADVSLTRVQGNFAGLAAVGSALIGAAEHGDLAALDGTPRYLGRIAGGIRRVASAGDGVLLVQRSSTAAPTFVELTPPSLELRPRDDLPPGLRLVRPVAPTLEYLLSEDGVVLRSNRRGRINEELSVGRLSEPLDVVAEGARRAVVVARYAGPFLRDEFGTWTDLGRPQRFATPRAVALLSRDRVLLAAHSGDIGIWEAGAWCTVPSPNHENVNAIAVAPGGEVAWLVGGHPDPDTPPLVLRLRAP